MIKFFLHVSKDEQKKRFLERIDITEKNWKFSAGDAKERVFWDDYMNAYEDAMEATSTDHSPWYVIPADKKWFTRLAISEIIVRKLESLDMTYPTMSTEHLAELQQAKKILEGEIAPHREKIRFGEKDRALGTRTRLKSFVVHAAPKCVKKLISSPDSITASVRRHEPAVQFGRRPWPTN